MVMVLCEGVGERRKRRPAPQMVLDVVPNSKMLWGSPSASNKIAGHPARPRGRERRLPSTLAPSPPQLCSLSAAPSPAVTGPPLGSWPQRGLAFTLRPEPCLPPTVSGVSAPGGLGDRSACHKPLLCNQEPCPSPARVFGEAVTQCLWLRSGKTRVPCSRFRPSLL